MIDAQTDTQQVPRRLRRLAHLLDSSIPLPGGFRMGLDGLIGLIPGVGDVIGGILSTYIIAEAARSGASRSTLIRMSWNVLIETLIGTIPVVGDLFDIGWKANQRNVALLADNLTRPQARRRADRGFVGLLALALLALIGVVALVAYAVLKGLYLLITA